MHLSACSVSTNSYLIFCLSRCIFNILFNTLDLLDPTQGYTYSISFSLSCLSVLQLCLHSLHNNSTCDQHTAHMHQWMFVFPTFLFFALISHTEIINVNICCLTAGISILYAVFIKSVLRDIGVASKWCICFWDP